jgi:hypothetical protein
MPAVELSGAASLVDSCSVAQPFEMRSEFFVEYDNLAVENCW